MRCQWATKSRKGKLWPKAHQAHHIIPLVYCSLQREYLPTIWWNISATNSKGTQKILKVVKHLPYFFLEQLGNNYLGRGPNLIFNELYYL